MKLGKVLGKKELSVSSIRVRKITSTPPNKTSETFWLKRVRKASGTSIFSVKMMVDGKYLNVSLGTSNQKTAAKRAAKLYLDLKHGDKDVALAHLAETRGTEMRRGSAPAPEEKEDEITVAWFIDQVSTILAPKATAETIYAYKSAFRSLVREIPAKKKLSCAEAEALPLASVTPAAVKTWRDSRYKKISESISDPLELNKKKRTINAIVRNASALFAKPILDQIAEFHGSPAITNPFLGLKPYPVPVSKYSTKIDIAVLIAAARSRFRKPVADDGGLDAAAWIIFILGFYSGLRSNETDKLQISQLDFDNRVISVRDTDCFKAKTRSSNADIPIEEEIVSELKWYCEQFGKGQKFVVCPEIPLPVGKTGPERRRLNIPFTRLCRWLRNYEVEGAKPLAGVQKPIHELRKEAGSVMLRNNDIYQASLFLRHSNIQTTVNHYADTRSKKTVGIRGMEQRYDHLACHSGGRGFCRCGAGRGARNRH